MLVFIVAGLIVQWLWPQPGLMRPLGYLPAFALFPLVACYLAAVIVAWHRWRLRREGSWHHGVEGWRAAWRAAVQGPLRHSAVARLTLASVFLPLLLNTFGSWKVAIPRWDGFSREASLVRWSLDLHGGAPGWSRLQPLLGDPMVTTALDRAYFTWLPVFVVMVLVQAAWREPARERTRFILALTMVWLGLGVVLATAGASAGPIFANRVLPLATEYDAMLQYLGTVDRRFRLITLDVRDILWTAKESRSGNPFTGISAFPSIHVAIATLYILATRSRWARAVAVAYALIIALASIHLGWHYAVDIYAGALGAVCCWFAAGAVAGRARSPSGR